MIRQLESKSFLFFFRDHLRSTLGITCGRGSFAVSGSFAVGDHLRYCTVPSTNFKVNKERLKHIFATYGTPKRIESDNRPPFSSKDFQEFALEKRFEHHKITPINPKENGEVK